MKRKKIVAGNWKMNLNSVSAVQLAKDIKAQENSFKCEVIVCPSFIFLSEVKKINGSTGIVKTGAQNCSNKEGGAYTGEVSVSQLKSAGIEYVIIGHSERREHYHETNEQLREKLQLALKHGLKPIFCCGEPLQIRQANQQSEYVKKQLEESLFVFTAEEVSNITIAYEPIWAIGTGLNATPAQAQEIHAFIRSQLAAKYSNELADKTRILYGGSCKPDNAAELFACPDVDGGLIGGASLKANDFLAIIALAG